MGGGWLSALLENNGEALKTVSGENPAESTEDPRRGSDARLEAGRDPEPEGVPLGIGGNTRTAPGISSALLDACSLASLHSAASLADSSWDMTWLM